MKIKSFSLVILLIIGYCYHLHAQVSVGAVVFPQISRMANKEIRKDTVFDNKTTFSGGAGLTLTYGFSGFLGVQTGLLYSSHNQKWVANYNVGSGIQQWKGKKRADYLKVPLLLRYVTELRNIDLVAFAGPQISYLLKYDGGAYTYIPNSYFDLPVTEKGNNYMKKMVLDFSFGANAEFFLSQYFDLVTGLKVDYGITDAENKNATLENGEKLFRISDKTMPATHNITYALVLGVNYKFSRANDLIAPSNKFRGKSYGRKRRF
ncbi:MAG: PorT family protein [Cytophagaceae bacterium]|nr:PorT family protein [Cytophagaceae bacterium]MDW8456915.1 outer membrane beta-barrel protein [Cytophagaceae bacterium]